MKIYLAGKVPKGSELDSPSDWRQQYSATLQQIPGFELLSPESPSLDHSRPFLVFGYDCYLIQKADVIIVNASLKLGVGTAQEMLIAKYFYKPVICVLPKDTHHRRTNLRMPSGIVAEWIHPFVFSTSDLIVEGIGDAVGWLLNYEQFPQKYDIKGIQVIDDAIQTYNGSGTA